MLDRWTLRWTEPPLRFSARRLAKANITPTQVTAVGFFIGLAAVPALWHRLYWVALVFIAINRICDGLDGALARLSKPTDAGGFLDIVLDFIFYSAVVWGFALADPERNAMPAATLIFSFVGTGVSFLAFAVMAAKRNIGSIVYPQKSLYYLGGITEGTETILLLLLFCLLPHYFPVLAYGFSSLCWITTASRVMGGFSTLRKNVGE